MHAHPDTHGHARPASAVADVWAQVLEAPAPVWRHEREVLPPVRDGIGWTLTKHVVQLAFVAMTLLVVLAGGGGDRLMVGGYVLTAFLLVGAIVLADRQRFRDRAPGVMLVELIEPTEEQLAATRPAPALVPASGPLVPLAADMAAALPWRVDVT